MKIENKRRLLNKGVVKKVFNPSDRRIDLNAIANNGNTALMFAVQLGRQDIVKLIKDSIKYEPTIW